MEGVKELHAVNKGPEDSVVIDEAVREQMVFLENVARRVGGDSKMKIKLGQPGGGSFFDPKEVSITFDPLHIKDSPSTARFVAGHEGAHRAITPGPEQIGLSREDASKLYSQIGFGYLQNVIEDPAVNDWMTARFPGLAEDNKKNYDEQFADENAALITPYRDNDFEWLYANGH